MANGRPGSWGVPVVPVLPLTPLAERDIVRGESYFLREGTAMPGDLHDDQG
ncbi:MAG: hypothetical protein U0791_11840 [Gemmataceae bacterium]